MNTAPDINQQTLAREFERLRLLLNGTPAPERAALPAESALGQICERFALSPFECDVLLLCAGVALDSTLAAEVAAHAPGGVPSFGMALGWPEAHWSALLPEAPLRAWHMLDMGAGSSIATAPLRIDERLLHALLGLDSLDPRLHGLVRPAQGAAPLAPADHTVARQLAAALALPPGLALLSEGDADTRQAIAAEAARQLGLRLWLADNADLPSSPIERASVARLWEREARLGDRLLLVLCEDQAPALAATLEAPLVLSSQYALRLALPHTRLAAPLPQQADQARLWQAALAGRAPQFETEIAQVAGHFRLSAGEIAQLAHASAPGELWQASRLAGRARLDALALRIASAATWDSLVLPEAHLNALHEIAVHVRQRAQVYGTWGFAETHSRGLGISALFAGPSGTGKTLAAEVIANELRLDLYRIDLSQMISKYIGETEKNLRRVFEAAEGSGAILLFDEADALFGKRSEVKDSHDRYANIEVSYLLQCMESYSGLAILTTNLRSAIDPAFLRRLRFVVEFPFPDAEQRAAIWRRAFPPATPTEGLAVEKLARLHLSGGNIHNIALHAAFHAAEAGQPIGMPHLLRAAQNECAKIDRPLNQAEVAGWLP